MSYLDRVLACNRLELKDTLPFRVDGAAFGWIGAQRAAVLARHADVFTVTAQGVAFANRHATPAARTAALGHVAPALVESGLFPRLRGEMYAAKRRWSDPAAFTLDRGMVAAFGLRAFGVHVNGFVPRADGLHLWVGTRAGDRAVDPNKLDNMVAGGQPAHLSLRDNLIKECAEEAGLPADLARVARPVGAISYAFSTVHGIKADTMFCYDLVVPPEFIPRNTDGEISSFELMPLAEVLRLVRDTDRFKFNVNLVVLDFGIRHGLIDPDKEPDFERIVAGLHRRAEPDAQAFIFGDQ